MRPGSEHAPAKAWGTMNENGKNRLAGVGKWEHQLLLVEGQRLHHSLTP